MAIRVMPMLQTMAAITSANWAGSVIVIQGETMSTTLQGSGYSDWVPCCFQSPAPNAFTAYNPYNSARARIVTVGWKLHYVGKVLEAQGVWTVRPIPIALDSVQQASTDAVFIHDAGAGSATTLGANNYMTARLDFGPGDSINLTPESLMVRPETNPHGVLRHAGTHSYKPYFERPVVAVQSGGGTPLNATQRSIFTVPRGYSNRDGLGIGFNFVDTEFNCTELYSSSAFGSYRLEVTTCVEYDIQPQSNVYPLTVAPPKQDDHAIATADTSVKSAPIALPAGKEIPIVSPPSTNSVDLVAMKNALADAKKTVSNATAVGKTVKTTKTVIAKPPAKVWRPPYRGKG